MLQIPTHKKPLRISKKQRPQLDSLKNDHKLVIFFMKHKPNYIYATNDAKEIMTEIVKHTPPHLHHSSYKFLKKRKIQ